MLKKTHNLILSTNSILFSLHNNVQKPLSKKPFKRLYHPPNSNRKFCYYFILLSNLSTKKEAGNMSIGIWCSITSLLTFLEKIFHKLKTKCSIVTMCQSMNCVRFLDGHVMLLSDRSLYPRFWPLKELLETRNRSISKSEESFWNH